MNISKLLDINRFSSLAVILACGILTGLFAPVWIFGVAQVVSELFINLLKLISLPIVFFSIISTASSMESVQEVKSLGGRVLKYTLMTTIIAATIALSLFVLLSPVQHSMVTELPAGSTELQGKVKQINLML